MSILFLAVWIIQISTAAAASNFTLGSTLAIAGSSNPPPIQSNKGVFALGFVDSSLGIWYVADPQKFLLWKPNTTMKGAVLEFSLQGQLRLFNSSDRTSIIWSSDNAGGAASGSLQDDGDLVLLTANGSGSAWSSWDHPKDTLLPGQNIPPAGLVAATDESSTGSYSLVESSGNLTLLWNGSLPYWSSNTAQRAAVAAMDDNGVLNLLSNASDPTSYVKRFYPVDYGPHLTRRLTLDPDGNLRIYTLEDGVWAAHWAAQEDQCRVYGHCGPFGICSYDPVTALPVCTCPRGLSPVNSRRRRLGCSSPAVARKCAGGEKTKMVEISRTEWLVPLMGQFSASSNLDGCRTQCINDATCFACMVPDDGTGICFQFRSAFVSAFSHPFLKSSALIKLCGVDAGGDMAVVGPSGARSCSGTAAKSAGVAITATIVAIVATEVLVWICLRRRRLRRRRGGGGDDNGMGYISGSPVRFSYKELQSATRNFSQRIGGGGFGAVYKGVLFLDKFGESQSSSFWKRNSNSNSSLRKMDIAVKKLEGVIQGDKEFRAEVAAIGSTHHVNLMHLVGFCSEGTNTRILVYEYMPNGSLDTLIFENSNTTSSSSNSTTSAGTSNSSTTSNLVMAAGFDERHEWRTRLGIAIGTAKGVAYLHEECRDCIVHCDLKPDNILLDWAFCPKVSDFGLARMMLEPEQGITSRSLASVRGTRGYLAPEWLLPNAAIGPKADVFSYGVILVELVTGKRSSEDRHLLGWVFRDMEASNILDRRVVDADEEQLERLLQVAFWCLQDSPQDRPSMSTVVHMLEAKLPIPPPPMPRNIGRGTHDPALFS